MPAPLRPRANHSNLHGSSSRAAVSSRRDVLCMLRARVALDAFLRSATHRPDVEEEDPL